MFILYCSCSIAGIHYGTGHHKADLSDENYAQAAQVSKYPIYHAQPKIDILDSFGGSATLHIAGP